MHVGLFLIVCQNAFVTKLRRDFSKYIYFVSFIPILLTLSWKQVFSLKKDMVLLLPSHNPEHYKNYFQEQYFQEKISENDQKGMMSCLVACVHSAAFKKTRVHTTAWAGCHLVHNPIYNDLGSHTVIWKPFVLRLPGLIRALSLKRSFAFVGGIWLVNFQLIQNFMGIVDGSGSVLSGLL